MSTPEERIAELARKNALSPTDAAKLLAAVKTSPVPSSTRSLFDRIGTPALLGIGVAASALSLPVAMRGVRFPGVFDMSRTDHRVGLLAAIADQIVVFPVAALVFWAVGRLVSKRARYIDMLATVGPARLPLIVSVLPVAFTGNAILAVLTVLGLALQSTFLVIGFRTATGARGKSLVLGIIGAIVAAEAIAKLLVYLIP